MCDIFVGGILLLIRNVMKYEALTPISHSSY